MSLVNVLSLRRRRRATDAARLGICHATVPASSSRPHTVLKVAMAVAVELEVEVAVAVVRSVINVARSGTSLGTARRAAMATSAAATVEVTGADLANRPAIPVEASGT